MLISTARRALMLRAGWLSAVALGLTGRGGSTRAAESAGGWAHGYAAYGEPKYPRGFNHFEYVDPTAPKGGTLYLRNPDRRTSFDKFNPFTVKGNSPAGSSAVSSSAARMRCRTCQLIVATVTGYQILSSAVST